MEATHSLFLTQKQVLEQLTPRFRGTRGKNHLEGGKVPVLTIETKDEQKKNVATGDSSINHILQSMTRDWDQDSNFN